MATNLEVVGFAVAAVLAPAIGGLIGYATMPRPPAERPVAISRGVGEVEAVRLLAERHARYRGRLEVILHDGSRVDILTDTEAIEADWADKWAEGVGQAMHYGELTGKRPGLLLLVTDPAHDWRGLVRAARLCGKLGISLYVEEVGGQKNRSP